MFNTQPCARIITRPSFSLILLIKKRFLYPYYWVNRERVLFLNSSKASQRLAIISSRGLTPRQNMDLRLWSQVQHLSVNADYACHCAGVKRGGVREGHFINTETKRALGALTPDCGAGIGRRRVGSSSVRKSPAVLQEGVGGTDLPTPLPLSVRMQIQGLLASGRGREVVPCAQHGVDWAAPCCWVLWEREELHGHPVLLEPETKSDLIR